MSCRILSCVELLTCLTFMVNNSNVVSNTMYNSHLDYIVIVLSVLLQVEQMGDPAQEQTSVRYYAFGGSVNPSKMVGFSTLTLGCFTTVKRESQDPRDL